MNYSRDHDNHLHVSFKAPSGSLPAECRSTGSGYGWELSEELEQDWEEFLDDVWGSFTKPQIEDRTAFTPKDRKIESESPLSIVVDPVPSMADFVNLARDILRKRLDRKQGVVLSIVHMSSGDTEDLIDRRTEKGKSGRQVLKNPPAHLVMPPEVYEIEWKPKRGKPQKIQFVWVLSNEISAFPVGGILFLTTVQINSFYLATFNVGALDDKRCTNVHHAEMQATRFIVEQPKTGGSGSGLLIFGTSLERRA